MAKPATGTDLDIRIQAEIVYVAASTGAEALAKVASNELPAGLAEPSPIYAEAIIIVDRFKRPALIVRNNTYEEPDSTTWQSILNPQRTKIEKAIRSVGRLELIEHPTLPYAGTAWMIAENIAVTNRHVASIFARKQGSAFPFLTGPTGKLRARIDFREEFKIATTKEVAIEKVLYIADPGDQNPDVALVQVAKDSRTPDPISLFNGKLKKGSVVVVIGYPANDPRNPAAAVSDIFGNVFEVKRLSPGEITGNPKGFEFTHDCATLGGNSGAVVIDVETGRAAGLHFGGRFRVNNYAVEAATLKKILGKLKTSVSVPHELIQEAPTKDPSLVLEDRDGYQEEFLGSKSAYTVPLPGVGSMKGEIANVKGTSDNVLRYTHFSIVMHAPRRFAVFTACNIDGRSSRNIRRGNDKWYLDGRLATKFQVGNALYSKNDLDRGHLVRRLDPVWGDDARQANDDTFFFTNSTPQHARLNQGNWNDLEDYVLNNTNAHNLRVSLFTGPVFGDDDPQYRGVFLPQAYWKVVAVVNGDTDKLHATAYMLSQADLLTDIEFVFGQFRTYQVPIEEVERQTRLSFSKLKKHDPLKDQEAFAIREITSLRDIVL